MGQAKERKKNDPGYGKPKHRGLVICSPGTVTSDLGLRNAGGQLHPQELRFALLFWDKLVWPTGLIAGGSGPDEEFLEQVRILERPRFNNQGLPGQIWLQNQLDALEQYSTREPGVWALSEGENSLNNEFLFTEPEPGAEIKLLRAIPIPTQETPLAEILEFKQRRSDELIAFRHHMESLTKNVHESADQSAELDLHIKEIQKVCSDLAAVGKEFQFPMQISDFSASVNFKPSLVRDVLGAWEGGSEFGLEIATIAAAAAGIRSAVKINRGPSFRPIKVPASPFKYAYYANRELLN